MHTIVFASQKGGVGKTTLAAHVAVAAGSRGVGRVVVIDMDPQGSMADWWNVRESDAPEFARVDLAALPGALEQLRAAGVGLVVVDTPPALSDAIKRIAELADLIVVPSRPSPLDLRAVAGTVDMLASLDRPMVFVVTAAPPRARITNDAVFLLSQHGKMAPVVVHSRIDFATSMTDGRTAGELDPAGRSAAEITELTNYLLKQLSGASAPRKRGTHAQS